jgi:glutamate racemase
VACNTASAASLHALRQRFPETPFVGMEPAVKPAAQNSTSHTVGVLATPATFQGELYASVVERFAEGVTVLQETLPGLVEQIEAGDLNTQRTRSILEKGVLPLLEQGADTLVLACTHFPLIIPLLLEIVGDRAQVIDPSPAIARQVNHLLEKHQLRNPKSQDGSLRLITTGDPSTLKAVLLQLLPFTALVETASWSDGILNTN